VKSDRPVKHKAALTLGGVAQAGRRPGGIAQVNRRVETRLGR
jgi:hypothetical protein